MISIQGGLVAQDFRIAEEEVEEEAEEEAEEETEEGDHLQSQEVETQMIETTAQS